MVTNFVLSYNYNYFKKKLHSYNYNYNQYLQLQLLFPITITTKLTDSVFLVKESARESLQLIHQARNARDAYGSRLWRHQVIHSDERPDGHIPSQLCLPTRLPFRLRAPLRHPSRLRPNIPRGAPALHASHLARHQVRLSARSRRLQAVQGVLDLWVFVWHGQRQVIWWLIIESWLKQLH